jgi:hypothetical protein
MRTPEEHATASAIIALMRSVVYRESAEDVWATLDRRGAPVRDVVVDDAEGYAYLRVQEADEGEEPLPRLVKRRTLTYNLSLLLVLLRKRLVEFETSSSDGKLVLTRDQLVDLVALFLPDATDEARAIERIDTTIRQAADLGFLRELRSQPGHWEVRRILKAYVDAQTLSDFAGKLAQYASQTHGAAP